jgi:hypothetical protein
MTINRRSLITGLISFAVTAPAIVRAASLMPVKVFKPWLEWDLGSGDMTAIWQISTDPKYAASYLYMVDGSLVIEKISFEDFYK